jgi:osmotically-inducible protein OsmY
VIRNDQTIRQDILEHLAWDARVDPINIDVQVEDGAVVLVGTTQTYGERIAAYEDTWTVPGVVSVDNQLLVSPPDTYELPSDAEIRDNIDRILRMHPSIDSASIEPVVEAGRVSLHGTVDAYWKKQRVESLVADIGGVVAIKNDIAVEPEPATTDEVIAKAVKTALARNVHVDDRAIKISVQNGLVTLAGTVPTWLAYREAYQSALHTTGVTGILDELTIQAAG